MSAGGQPQSNESPGGGGYSAAVRLFLRLNGEQIPLAHVGSERLYFDTPMLLPAGPAELVIEIDGRADATSVLLPECTQPERIVTYSVA